MAHDKLGNELHTGDHVIIRAIVTRAADHEGPCNVTVQTEEIARNWRKPHVLEIHSTQVELSPSPSEPTTAPDSARPEIARPQDKTLGRTRHPAEDPAKRRKLPPAR